MTESGQTDCAGKFVEFLARFRYPIMLLYLAAAVLSVLSLKNIRSDNSDESFFREGDPAVTAIDKFRKTFGSEDVVYLAVKTDAVFRYPELKRLEALADALGKDVPHIGKVTWIGSAEYMRGAADEIRIGPIVDEIPESPEALEKFRETALGFPPFVNTFISEDAKTAVIVLECARYPDNADDPRKEIVPAIHEVLKRPEFTALETYLAGTPAQDYETDRMTRREAVKLSLICLIVQSVLLFRIGRGIRAVVVPVAVIVLSILMTLGIVGMAGLPVSLMDIMVPTMLFSVCLGDTVHIIAAYRIHRVPGVSGKAAVATAVREVFMPCLFTSLTTMAGFLSFLATDIAPIRMAGIYSAVGVGLAFILAVTLTPIAYLTFPEKEINFQFQQASFTGRLDSALRRLAAVSIKFPKTVIAFFVVTSIMSVWFYQGVTVETNIIQNISTSEKLRQDFDFFDVSLGGAMSLEIMADTGQENGARDLRFLKDVEKLQRHAETFPKTVTTHSIVDTVKRLRKVLYNNDPAYHGLPDEQKSVSQYLFFYETAGGKNLDKEMSLLSDTARIHVQTRTMGTQEVKSFMRDMDNFIAAELGGRLHVQYTGQMAWVSSIADYVKQGQAVSLLSSVVGITVMMILCLRSVPLGLISMLPNIVPILTAMGLMGLSGIDLSLMLMVFSSVIYGICIDDTTYFFVNFKRNFARMHDYREAIFETVKSIGHPVVFTTVLLIVGFLVFTLSTVRSSGQFGVLGAAAFFWGCLADLTLSPALVSVLKPLGRER
jgi:predicted RND superfamily exporter protein